MKANELRIGNYVLNDECICKIFNIYGGFSVNCTLKTKQGNQITAHYELLNPIPLTDDWLIKFGFEGCEDYEGWQHKKTGIMFYKGFLTNIQKHSIKYVHQFQNLYFALTGEELIIESE